MWYERTGLEGSRLHAERRAGKMSAVRAAEEKDARRIIEAMLANGSVVVQERPITGVPPTTEVLTMGAVQSALQALSLGMDKPAIEMMMGVSWSEIEHAAIEFGMEV